VDVAEHDVVGLDPEPVDHGGHRGQPGPAELEPEEARAERREAREAGQRRGQRHRGHPGAAHEPRDAVGRLAERPGQRGGHERAERRDGHAERALVVLGGGPRRRTASRRTRWRSR
jgi:hypothetical protein